MDGTFTRREAANKIGTTSGTLKSLEKQGLIHPPRDEKRRPRYDAETIRQAATLIKSMIASDQLPSPARSKNQTGSGDLPSEFYPDLKDTLETVSRMSGRPMAEVMSRLASGDTIPQEMLELGYRWQDRLGVDAHSIVETVQERLRNGFAQQGTPMPPREALGARSSADRLEAVLQKVEQTLDRQNQHAEREIARQQTAKQVDHLFTLVPPDALPDEVGMLRLQVEQAFERGDVVVAYMHLNAFLQSYNHRKTMEQMRQSNPWKV